MHESKATRTWLSSIVERLRRRRDGREYALWTVDTSLGALSVTRDSVAEFRGRTESWSAEWTDIRRVVASKTDNFTYGTIWISIFGNETILFSFPDDAEGFLGAVRSLPEHLPGTRAYESWIQEVAVPPFDPGEIQIYPVTTA